MKANRVIAIVVMLVFCLLVSSGTPAQNTVPLDGNWLNGIALLCSRLESNPSSGSEAEKSAASGALLYVSGVRHGIMLGSTLGGNKKIVCIPDKVTAGQILKMAHKYLDSHPQELHEPAAAIVLEALIEEWGC